MKAKISHNGAAITIREYEVRELNRHGDAYDVSHFGNKRAALAAASRFLDTFERMIQQLVDTKLIRREASHLLVWIGPG